MIIKKVSFLLIYILIVLLQSSCSKSGIRNLFTPNSPYEKYLHNLKEANIDKTALGADWITEGERAVRDSLFIETPFRETGYFSDEKVRAVGFNFLAKRGEVIAIEAQWESRNNSNIFLDLFVKGDFKKPVASADSILRIKYEVKNDQEYSLRLQPELLRGGKYILTITKEPSMLFPVSGKDSRSVGSFFGAARDGGKRKHEGLDIFAPKRTPVIAIAEGRITRVGENKLGGKVVFLNASDKNYTLYYAHLDTQMVAVGEMVLVGDTLGLIGNTGNAKFTPPHLHFGIYTWGGPIDPYPFLAKSQKTPENIRGNPAFLNSLVKAKDKKTFLYALPASKTKSETYIEKNTLFNVIGLTGDYYRISLPDKRQAYIKYNQVEALNSPVKTVSVKNTLFVFDYPESSAVMKDSISVGEKVDVFGVFNDYLWVGNNKTKGWVNAKL